MYRKHYNKMSNNAKMLYESISSSLQGLINRFATKPKTINVQPIFSKYPELKNWCDEGNKHLQEVVGETLDSALETLNELLKKAEEQKLLKDKHIEAAAIKAQIKLDEDDTLLFKTQCKEKLLRILMMCYEQDIDAIADVMIQSKDNDRVAKATEIATESVIKAANVMKHSAFLAKDVADSNEGENTQRLVSIFPNFFNKFMDVIVDAFNKFNNNIIEVADDDVDSNFGLSVVTNSSKFGLSVVTTSSISVANSCKSSMSYQYVSMFEWFVMPVFKQAIKGTKVIFHDFAKGTKDFVNDAYDQYKSLSKEVYDEFHDDCIDTMRVTTNTLTKYDSMTSSSSIPTSSSSIPTTSTMQQELEYNEKQLDELLKKKFSPSRKQIVGRFKTPAPAVSERSINPYPTEIEKKFKKHSSAYGRMQKGNISSHFYPPANRVAKKNGSKSGKSGKSGGKKNKPHKTQHTRRVK
jgi:hypothetical protein